jgi:hypothetical protein
MIAWSRRHTLFAGLALILAVNGIALSGVALNRSGEPVSLVQLSERELQLPYGRWNSRENSGVELSLKWRVNAGHDTQDDYDGYASYGGTASWLDETKMAALGFDLAQDRHTPRWKNRQNRTKEVLLLLELDGAAYQQSLERARKKAEDEEKLRADNPGNKEFENRAKRARAYAESEAGENSRLFAVDAGLDIDALRAKYPDRTRYIIARGQLRAQIVTRDRQDRLSGHISALSISRINVPVAFQHALNRDERTNKTAHFEASVAYGQRLEPWIVTLVDKGGE